MSGTDKTALAVGGLSLLDRALAAAAGAASIVVVGPARPVSSTRVVWVREEPPGGGPAAAIAAALGRVDQDHVVVLAADLPLVTARHLDQLVATLTHEDGAHLDGAVYVDDEGNEQWLCSCWRTDVLRRATLAPHASLRAALSDHIFSRLVDPAAAVDCDTPDELRRAEELLT